MTIREALERVIREINAQPDRKVIPLRLPTDELDLIENRLIELVEEAGVACDSLGRLGRKIR